MAYKNFGGDILISASLKSRILKEVAPSKVQEKQLQKTVDSFISILRDSVSQLGYDVEFYVGGSFGKGTYLKHSFDVDIFCRCSMEYDDASLSKLVEDILVKSEVPYHREKGSRDYFSGIYELEGVSIKYELVPTRRIEKLSQACNSTDYSYLHVEYIKDASKNNPDLQNEIRLAKAFLKSKGWYGAESYIGGFSGHIVDLLICYYGSLEKLLDGARLWQIGQVIDVANHFATSKEALQSIDNSKHSSLIVVDSILPQRNAARALSSHIFGDFLVWIHTHERLEYNDFVESNCTTQDYLVNQKKFAKEKGYTLISCSLAHSSNPSQDIAGAKLKKLYEKIFSYVSELGFEIVTSSFFIEKSFEKTQFFYHISQPSLPKEYLLRGPPVTMGDALKHVISKKTSYIIKGNHVFYFVKRDITHIDDAVSLSLDDCKEMMSSDINFITTFEMKKLL